MEAIGFRIKALTWGLGAFSFCFRDCFSILPNVVKIETDLSSKIVLLQLQNI